MKLRIPEVVTDREVKVRSRLRSTSTGPRRFQSYSLAWCAHVRWLFWQKRCLGDNDFWVGDRVTQRDEMKWRYEDFDMCKLPFFMLQWVGRSNEVS